MAASELSVGLLVNHETWGLGKVLHLDSQDVWVYFKDIRGTPKDAVKKLKRRVAVLTAAGRQSDSALDNLPPMVQDGRVKPPETVRITEQQAVEMFVAKFPVFDHPEYLKYERDYKWEAHRQVAAQLLSTRGRRMVEEGPSTVLTNTLKKLVNATNLLATQELIALNDALKDERAAQRFAESVLDFVADGGEQAFDGLVETVGSLPAETGRARVVTWPIVTLLPFLAQPDRFMFFKPRQTQRIAEAFSFELLYSAHPKWATYDRLLTLSNRLLERLRPLGARDLIDVQSFMWVVAGSPFMNQARSNR